MINSNGEKKDSNKLAKYSGLAFQLLAFIAVGYFIGLFIDKKIESNHSYGVAFSCTLFLLIGIVSVVRDILREK